MSRFVDQFIENHVTTDNRKNYLSWYKRKKEIIKRAFLAFEEESRSHLLLQEKDKECDGSFETGKKKKGKKKRGRRVRCGRGIALETPVESEVEEEEFCAGGACSLEPPLEKEEQGLVLQKVSRGDVLLPRRCT